MKNSSFKPQFPRKARPSGRTRFGAPARSSRPTSSPITSTFTKPTREQSERSQGLMTPVRTKGPSPIPTRAPGEFPMRINKYLSWKGYCTRAGADELIKKRAVTINGRLAVIGEQIQETDIIELRANRPQEAYVYYAYNKARGISTEPTTKGTSISQKIHLKNVFPVCGLDTHSDGLVILTNDRRIVNRLLNPAHSHMKVYAVRTVNPVKPNFKEKMEAGVILGQKDTRGAGIHGAPSVPIQCTVHMMSDSLFSIRVAETDSRVRQMVSLFFAEVENITRTEILNIKLDTLPPNSYRVIEGDELKEFLHYLGL